MRRLHYDVRPATLEELDASATRAREGMVAHQEQGEHALAEVCESAMNRFLEARAKLQATSTSA